MSNPPYWFYIDDEEQFQGPFSHADMVDWLRDDYFTVATRVCAAFSESDPMPTDKLEFEAIMNRTDFLEKTELAKLKQDYLERQAREASTETPVQPTPSTNASVAVYTDEWFYLDKNEKEQGPFSVEQLQTWIEAGYIDPDLRIRNSTTTEFTPILSLPSSPFKFPSANDNDAATETSTDTSAVSAAVDTVSVADALAIVGDRMWYYLDDRGCRRGPWSTHQMRYWASKGFLSGNNIRLRLEGEMEYVGWRDHPAICVIIPGKISVNKWDVRRIRKARKGEPLAVWTGQCEAPSPDADKEKEEEEEEKQIVSLLSGKLSLAGGIPDSTIPAPYSAGAGAAFSGYSTGMQSSSTETSISGTGTSTESAGGAAAVMAAVTESSTITSNYQPSLWLYLDSSGNLQGPYPEAMMHSWYMAGALPSSLKVRRVSEPTFVELQKRSDCMFTLNDYMNLYERTALQTFVRPHPQYMPQRQFIPPPPPMPSQHRQP